MTPDVTTGDPTKMVCLHCARRIVSPRAFSKFDRLRSYLRFRGSFTNRVELPFAKIDGIIGDNLPLQAYRSDAWWNNSPSQVHSKAWVDEGWEVESVNLKEAKVVFHKVRMAQAPVRGRRRKNLDEIKKPFTPVPVRIPKTRIPSKTKVSKLYARIKNIERQSKAMPTYHGSFRPKPRYEKQLFRSDRKPQ
jgi:hypothetical protein